MSITHWAGALALLVSAAMHAGADHPEAGAMAIAERLVEAFNRHDPAAMAALLDDQFELYYFDEAGKALLSAQGPADLREQMVDYFASRPNVRSEIEARIDGPRFASFRERAVSVRDGVERSASSLAVYEVVNGKIRRVWYYPAESPREGKVGE